MELDWPERVQLDFAADRDYGELYLDLHGDLHQFLRLQEHAGVRRSRKRRRDADAHQNGYRHSHRNGTGCTATAIVPYIQVGSGSWQQTASVEVSQGSGLESGAATDQRHVELDLARTGTARLRGRSRLR